MHKRASVSPPRSPARPTEAEEVSGVRLGFPGDLESEESEAEEIATQVLAMLKNADLYLALGEKVISEAKPKLVKALGVLIAAAAHVRSELEPQLGDLSVVSALALRRDYENYVKAGFTRDQAFKLIMATIKPINFGEALSTAGRIAQSSKNAK